MLIENRTDSIIYTPSQPIIQEVGDTLWGINRFIYEMSTVPIYSYKWGDSVMETSKPISSLIPIKIVERAIDIIPYSNPEGEYIKINPHATYRYKFAYRCRFDLPNYLSLRISKTNSRKESKNIFISTKVVDRITP